MKNSSLLMVLFVIGLIGCARKPLVIMDSSVPHRLARDATVEVSVTIPGEGTALKEYRIREGDWIWVVPPQELHELPKNY